MSLVEGPGALCTSSRSEGLSMRSLLKIGFKLFAEMESNVNIRPSKQVIESVV